MTISNALASMPVTDLSVASAWYERFLGPARRPMDEVIEWQLPNGGGLQVYVGPGRAGHGSCTLVVDDIDETATMLLGNGVAVAVDPQRGERVDTIMIKDPDGNTIAFAAPKDASLVR